MVATLTKVCNSGVRLVVESSVVHTILNGPHSSLFKSYVAFLGRSKVNKLLDDWKDVLDEGKKDTDRCSGINFNFYRFDITLYKH